MPSLVELIFEAHGIEPTAEAVRKLSAAIDDNAKALAREGVTSVATAQGHAALSQVMKEQAAARAQAVLGTGTFMGSLRNLSAEMTDRLTPALDATTKNLLAVGVAALSARAVWQGFKGALAEGSELERLHLRTGEAIRDLAVEEQAFKNAGLGARFLGTASNLLERALDPMSVNAKRSSEVFREMGVSMPELKAMSFYQQLQALEGGLEKLPDQAARVDAMMKLFGRYQGGQMLQLLGDPNALALAEQQAGRLGDRMEQDAAAFNHASQELNVINTRMKELFVAAAEQVLPSLESIARVIGGMNLSGLGTVIGAAGPSAAGGLAAIWGIDKLDSKLMSAAERFGGTMRGTLAGVASEFTGALGTLLPLGLAAVLAEQIIAGIVKAKSDSRLADERWAVHAEASGVEPYQKMASGVRNQGDVDHALTMTAARMALLADEQTKLEGEQKAAKAAAIEASTHPSRRPDDMGSPMAPTVTFSDAEVAKLKLIKAELFDLQTIERGLNDRSANASNMAKNQLADLQSSLEPLVAKLPQLRAEADKNALTQMDPAHRVMKLQSQRSGLETQLQASPAAGATAEQSEAWRLDLKLKIAALAKEEASATKEMHAQAVQLLEQEKKISAEKQAQAIYALETQMEQAKDAGNDALAQKLKEEIELKRASVTLSGVDLDLAKQRVTAEHQIWAEQQAQKAAKDAVNNERTALDSALNQVRENLATLQGDYTRTDAEKWADRKKAIEEEIATLKASIAADQLAAQNARAGGHPDAAATFEQSAHQTGGKLASTQGEQARRGPDPSAFLDQITAKLTAVRNSMGTWQQSIASGFSSAFSNASAGLQQLIGDTQFWSQKLGNIAGPIMGGLTKAIADMFTTWIAQRGLAALKSIFFSEQEGAADTAAKAPGAVLSSISSFGVAAAVGVAAIIGAMAAFGGFREAGGSVSAGGAYIVGERRPEVFVPHSDGYIFPSVGGFAQSAGAAPSFRAPTAPTFGGSGRGQSSPPSVAQSMAAAVGGAVGSAAQAAATRRDTPRNTHFYMDPRSFARAMQEHSTDYFRQIAREEIRNA